MTVQIEAACNCGLVKFTSNKEALIQVCCHCQDCRDATKNDFSEIAFFNEKSVHIEGAVSALTYYAESGNKTTRERCSSCKTLMFDRSEGFPGIVGVVIQQMIKPFSVNIGAHVWVSSKVKQVTIPPNVKVFEKGLS
ncbi:hypothetical protein P886_4472 [Alteromonadaceae bacterium 2753L.S.0a.02]|nr:hypothetical protein P886_4472 [Alteromonadaceae bacterium 2753L.S.0a.02]